MDETANAFIVSGLNEADVAVVFGKLMGLLSSQAARYTTGDSSSVREETARELLSSIRFTLDLGLRDRGLPASALVSADLDGLFSQGIGLIEKKLEAFDRLYEAACLGALELENLSYRDTLKSLGFFRRRYDYRLFAHAVPCDIDYQLCLPVPETLSGVEYVNEYLRRVVLENDFLRRFPKKPVIGLLESYCPDWQGLLINLYEPVAANALGLALLGRDVRALDISDEVRDKIAGTLAPLSEDTLRGALGDAAAKACAMLNLRDTGARDYLARTADALCPRLDTALSSGGLDGIFLSFS